MMTERPQLSVVGGGQERSETGPATGVEAVRSTAMPHSRDHLAAALRAQREANTELMLDAAANKTAEGLSAKRQDHLVAQLQKEIAARQLVEAQLRELRMQTRVLSEQLAQAASIGQAMRQENGRIASKLEAAVDTISDLRQQVSEASVWQREAAVEIEKLKAVKLEQSVQIAVTQAAIDGEKIQQLNLASQLTNIQAEAAAAEASLRAAMGSNRALTALLQSERAAAIAVAEALEAEKVVLAGEVDALKASYAEMSGKAETRFLRVNDLAAQLTGLREDVSQKGALIDSLKTALEARNLQSRQLTMENADLVRRVEALQSASASREAAMGDISRTLEMVRAEAGQREEQLRASLVLAADESQSMALRVEEVEAGAAKLVLTEQALRAEVAELNMLVDERRQTIRQLQQELALLKLGKKR